MLWCTSFPHLTSPQCTLSHSSPPYNTLSKHATLSHHPPLSYVLTDLTGDVCLLSTASRESDFRNRFHLQRTNVVSCCSLRSFDVPLTFARSLRRMASPTNCAHLHAVTFSRGK